MNLLLLNKNGTLISSTFKANQPDQEIVEKAKKRLEKYKDSAIVVACNQGVLARGQQTLKEAIAEMRELLTLFPQINYILFCPDRLGEECWQISSGEPEYKISDDYKELVGQFRKPSPGMFQIAIDDFCKDSGDKITLVSSLPADRFSVRSVHGLEFISTDKWIGS